MCVRFVSVGVCTLFCGAFALVSLQQCCCVSGRFCSSYWFLCCTTKQHRDRPRLAVLCRPMWPFLDHVDFVFTSHDNTTVSKTFTHLLCYRRPALPLLCRSKRTRLVRMSCSTMRTMFCSPPARNESRRKSCPSLIWSSCSARSVDAGPR